MKPIRLQLNHRNNTLVHSMNHYSPGAVCAFLYDTVCGINISGENRFQL